MDYITDFNNNSLYGIKANAIASLWSVNLATSDSDDRKYTSSNSYAMLLMDGKAAPARYRDFEIEGQSGSKRAEYNWITKYVVGIRKMNPDDPNDPSTINLYNEQWKFFVPEDLTGKIAISKPLNSRTSYIWENNHVPPTRSRVFGEMIGKNEIPVRFPIWNEPIRYVYSYDYVIDEWTPRGTEFVA